MLVRRVSCACGHGPRHGCRLVATATATSGSLSSSSQAAMAAELQGYPSAKPLYAKQMTGYLQRPAQPTLLPPPLPTLSYDFTADVPEGKDSRRMTDIFSAIRGGSTLYKDSTTVDLLSVIDACLHNFNNVPRAKGLFERIKSTAPSTLDTRIYNRVLLAYLGMAQNPNPPASAQQQAYSSDYWLAEFRELYEGMESNDDAAPDPTTYALLFLANIRFKEFAIAYPKADPHDTTTPSHVPESILQSLLYRGIDVVDVVSSRVVEDKEAPELIKLMSKTAVKIGQHQLLVNLDRIESLCRDPSIAPSSEAQSSDSSSIFPDPLQGVPDVRPVRKMQKLKVEGEDGKMHEVEDAPEIEGEIPFNLDNLRKHLAGVALSRRVLPEDVASRQKLLEDSMHDVALSRLEYEAQQLQALGTSKDLVLRRDSLQQHMWQWHQLLMPRLEKEIKNIQAVEEVQIKQGGRGSKKEWISPFLSLLKSERLSLIVIMEVMRLAGTGGIADGMKTARALIQVGKAIEIEYKAKICKSSNIRLAVPTSQIPSSPSASTSTSATSYFTSVGYRSLQARRVAAARLMTEGEEWMSDWSQVLRGKVGGILVDCLMEVATVTRTMKRANAEGVEEWLSEEQPAFYHTYEIVRGQRLGVIRLNPVVAERMAKDHVGGTIHPRHLPMLIKPKPWVAADQGGYLYSKSSVMRFKDSVEQESYLKRASDLGNVELVYAGLDVLGSTPWRINKKVFDVVLQVWNSGERLGKMPPAYYDQPEPQMDDIVREEMEAKASGTSIAKEVQSRNKGALSSSPLSDIESLDSLEEDDDLLDVVPSSTSSFHQPNTEPFDSLEGMDQVVKSIYKTRMKVWQNGKANTHSQRCSVNYKMEIARAFLGDVIYQPHNLDFRGRAYPIPPHLNHIGDDLSRGIMCFAEGKPLGERGFRWLKIHLANLYGYDKANFDDRVKWTEDRFEEIFDSATKPLEGSRWWTHADDPWQCLGACYELHAALNHPDGPEAYVSNLPVHQDGTCNGLQHYAALGGDAEGAAQVNLSAADKPSDVYSYVGGMVEQTLEKDKADGHHWATILSGKITRKVVKQTVMTTVYGVTYVGAREQIERQLKDRGDIKAEDCWDAASYLTKVVLNSIGDLFSGATNIQNWLTLSARLIAKSIPAERLQEALAEYRLTKDGENIKALPSKWLRKEQMTSVIWTTPLGLPIVQPYRKTAKKQITTALQTIFIADPNSPSEVNSQKQASAFPPNFIHSLDATHMMLTALECRAQNITFASVHDSYWTHACSIDNMSEIIRETFVALHSSDILEKLHNEFTERYKNYKIPLLQLRSAGLINLLAEAGVKLTVKPSQAKSLRHFSRILQVSESESMIDESQAAHDLSAYLDSAKYDREGTLMDSSGTNSVAQEFIHALGDEAEITSKGSQGKGKIVPSASDLELMGKFVNLTDLIPPLPKKGTFSVEEIKRSPYFFS